VTVFDATAWQALGIMAGSLLCSVVLAAIVWGVWFAPLYRKDGE